MNRYKDELGRKVNDTMVFHETVARDFTKSNGLRRNLTLASTIPPEKMHVARIRKSYEMHQTKSYVDWHGTFSPSHTLNLRRKSTQDLDYPPAKKRSRNMLGRSQEYNSSPAKRRSKHRSISNLALAHQDPDRVVGTQDSEDQVSPAWSLQDNQPEKEIVTPNSGSVVSSDQQ